MLKQFWHDESGVTAIEYGLIAALIGVACIVAMQFAGRELEQVFRRVGEVLRQATK